MAKPNTTCHNCDKKYYVCRDCEDLYSYRLVACSPKCYRELMKKNIKAQQSKEEETSKTPIVATKTTKKTTTSVTKEVAKDIEKSEK